MIALSHPLRSLAFLCTAAPLSLLACSSKSSPGNETGTGGAPAGPSGGQSGHASGGNGNSGDAGGNGGDPTSGGQSSAGGGQTNTGGSGNTACGASCQNAAAGSCSAPEVRVTEVALGIPALNNESETELEPLVLAASPTGGARLGFMSDDGALHIAELDCEDRLVGAPFALPAHDFQDIAADADGGVAVLTRDARGGGTLNCGEPANLCNGGPEPAVPCHEMWMVRYDCAGNVEWTTALTTSSDTLPPYSTGPTGPMSLMIWWYQHHGRLAYDGENYAAYFGVAISISENECINIHQGDRMQVVGPDGATLEHPDDFGEWGIGCSHSWNTRIVWDEEASKFVMVCATDNQGRVALPDPYRTIYAPEDLATLSVGDLVVAQGGGYWVTASDMGTIHLLHFEAGLADQDIEIAASDFSHLVAYGEEHMIVAWEDAGQIAAKVVRRDDGSDVSDVFTIPVPDNRYHWFEAMADGSVAYAAPSSDPETVRIARVLPCE